MSKELCIKESLPNVGQNTAVEVTSGGYDEGDTARFVKFYLGDPRPDGDGALSGVQALLTVDEITWLIGALQRARGRTFPGLFGGG